MKSGNPSPAHVHELKRLLLLWAKHEAAMDLLVPRKRRADRSKYAFGLTVSGLGARCTPADAGGTRC